MLKNAETHHKPTLAAAQQASQKRGGAITLTSHLTYGTLWPMLSSHARAFPTDWSLRRSPTPAEDRPRCF